ncbi:MAG TPA: VOC family protein [Ornithinibacter sp.]|nr:VOC family protein [Ornithinibacter sp.]
MQRLGLVTLVVRDYDEAIAFYVEVLGFALREDTSLPHGARWVVVCAGPDDPTGLLLARATSAEQLDRVGDQTGGRVGFFLNSDDFATDHARLVAAGVHFLEEPRYEAYGSVPVFKDLYGNRWDLVELD